MRFFLARFLLAFRKILLRLASVCGTFIVLILKPEDHEKLTRWFYEKDEALETWGNQAVIEQGLVEEEEIFVSTYLKGKEKCLVLNCGGGRETIALAKRGFEVIGVDQSGPLVEEAKRYAVREGLSCRYVAQNVLELSLGETFGAIFLGSNMYSAIPLKEKRIAFLKRAGAHLSKEGLFYMEFAGHVSPQEIRHYPVKKFLAGLFGNRFYGLGDRLFAGWHYEHAFFRQEDLQEEITASGLEAAVLDFRAGYAVLRRA